MHGVHRSNLPQPLTSFIGRETEILQVERLIAVNRLVTITGVGGVGKTRLAIQAAGEVLPRYRDGVWWVELAGRSTGEPVTQAVVKSLRIPEAPGVAVLERIVTYLTGKQLLLVLDNCDHFLDDCADLIEYLISACPDLTVLVTSFEDLGIVDEKVWLLHSLPLLAPEQLADIPSLHQAEAVELFIERVTAFNPSYQPDQAETLLITQICRSLDGIPLAIELAAARMNQLSAAEIADGLEEHYSQLTSGGQRTLPRQQTLKVAIAWSYELLNPLDQMIFRRLTVFAGSFGLEAALAVCAGAETQAEVVHSILNGLVDAALLQLEPPLHENDAAVRFRLLDPLSSFGRLMVGDNKETEQIPRRHAEYFVNLVESAEPELLSQKSVEWQRVLKLDSDDLRAVFDWSSRTVQAESALRLAGALTWFWFRAGTIREGCVLALSALAIPSEQEFQRGRARALNTAGFLLCLLGDTRGAREKLEEALGILNTIDDPISLAWTYQFLGLTYSYEWDYTQADAAFNQGLAMISQLGEASPTSFLHFYGDVDLLRGNPARAKKHYEESAAILGAAGNGWFLAYPLRRLGFLALEENDLQRARSYFLESLQNNRQTGDPSGLAASLVGLAALALRQGQARLAVRFYREAERLLERFSINLLYLDQLELGRAHTQLHAVMDRAEFDRAFSSDEVLEIDQALADL